MMAMAVRRTSYPQVEPRAADLVTATVAVVPRTLALGEAAGVLSRRRAGLVVARVGRGWAFATADVLARARALGLDGAPLDAVLWAAPAVGRRTPEAAVRRALGPATPVVLVVDGEGPVGAIAREAAAPAALPRSAAAALARLEPGVGRVLDEAGRLGEALGWPVAVVGGVPRDLLGGWPAGAARDLDVVVEGDGREFARRLAERTGGAVREHPAFGTATVALPDGGRLDVATARRERYARPGALPTVEPATLAEDLARRDFSVNALAVRLDGAARGRVVDPAGGLADLARRRIRVLHPLSFVEDPTRVFRAARFATRLGFRLDATTRRLARAAARLDVYADLSGERLMGELRAILREPSPPAVLVALARLGAFRLVEPGYRPPAGLGRRLARVAAIAGGTGPETGGALYLLALGAGLEEGAAEAWAARWGVPAPGRAAMARARRDGPALARRLAGASPATAYTVLSGTPGLSAAWAAALSGTPRVRGHVGAYRDRWRRMPRLLTGHDLKALGLAPGPRFGTLLAEVRRAQAAGRVRTREAALDWARRALARPNGRSPRIRVKKGE
jgi:tRNA nucleotidyltransferase (CCA-adding enzyme)